MTTTEIEQFPIVWDDPAMAAMPWQRDRFHWPDPVSPLAWSVQQHCFVTGMGASMAGFYVPVSIHLTRVNTYVYLGLPGGPPADVPPEELQAGEAKTEAAFQASMARMWSLWEDDLLPEIHQHLAFWETFDLAGAALPALASHLEETVERFTRLLDIHFKAVLPAYLAVSELDELYRQMIDDGSTGAFDAYRLIQGLPNKTVEVGHELWKLSRAALAAPPEVAAALRSGAGRPGAETFARLEETEAGRAFAAHFHRYLEVYGQRGDKFFDMDKPAWLEEPAPAFDTLRTYMSQPDSADPGLAATRLAAEREEAVAATRARIAGYPAPAKAGFEFLLEAATAGIVVTEDHGFWIDFRSAYKVRQVLLEVGRRLAAAGVADETEDVFMLTLDEARSDLAALVDGRGVPDRRAAVKERRAEMEHFATVRAPDLIGAPPSGPPPKNPMTRAFGKFSGDKLGGLGANTPEGEPGLVKGIPGSPGRVKGVARVIRVLSDADRLAPGEILVTETTTPPWTPLFAVAGGLVSDTGGVLSHSAVVAREYGLPAVVGTGRGTDRIVDGMVIEVDGDAGLVHLPDGA